jgi:hypothetical protein
MGRGGEATASAGAASEVRLRSPAHPASRRSRSVSRSTTPPKSSAAATIDADARARRGRGDVTDARRRSRQFPSSIDSTRAPSASIAFIDVCVSTLTVFVILKSISPSRAF